MFHRCCALLVILNVASLCRGDDRQLETARGRVELQTVSPLVPIPENPRLVFELVEHLAPQWPIPPELRDDPKARAKWFEEWRASPQGREFFAAHEERVRNARRIPFTPDAQGHFVVHQVPYGAYVVKARSDDSDVASRMGVHSWRVVVSDQMVQDNRQHPSARVVFNWPRGARAPHVELTYFDGKKGTLSELQGKVVVMYFWATWCAGCIEQMPEWNAVRAEFDDDDRVLFLEVNGDNDIERARDYARQNGYQGPQIVNGPSDTGPVNGPFGLRGWPAVVVIDRDGRIACSDLFPGSELLAKRIKECLE